MRIPRLFDGLCICFGLSPAERATLWWAFNASRWSQVNHWKYCMAQLDDQCTQPVEVLRAPYGSPGVVLDLVEALVRERVLSRAKAVPIEGRVLAKVNGAGYWRELPPPTSAPLPELAKGLASIIEDYWR